MFLWLANQFVSNVTELFQVLVQCQHLTGVIPPSSRVPIHALIIGIDDYQLRPLAGAVNDAKSMEAYLKNDLMVPPSQVHCLFNKSAKRAAIIKAFQHLKTRHEFKENDAIIIYYAGHGTELNPQPGWEAGGPGAKIQAIVPQDHSDMPGQEVPVIPDRTLGALINSIAKKSNNITVIFDSCHSGSGTRLEHSTSRGIKVKHYLPRNLDLDILASDGEAGRAGMTASGYERNGLESHVLIAACGQSEEAKESFTTIDDVSLWRGNFTTAFLALLRSGGTGRLTYADIQTRLTPLPHHQHPQIEGVNLNRFIFDSKGPAIVDATYDVQPERDGKYLINAGTVHAISVGAEFTIYKDADALQHGPPLGILEVSSEEDIKSLSTTLSLPAASHIELAAPGLAVQTKTGRRVDLRLYLELREVHLPVFYAILEQLEQTGMDRYRIANTNRRTDAHLEFSAQGKRVVINILDKRATVHGLNRIPFELVKPTVQRIGVILRSAAHFYRHLDTVNTNRFIPSKIEVEFSELEEGKDFDDDGYYVLEAVGENLVQEGVVDLVVRHGVQYGVKITNRTPWHLYPDIFLFENSDLSITSYYESRTVTGNGSEDVAPLQKEGGTLTIGYGSGGGNPYNFSLRKNDDLDISFLKFYFSNKSIDLSGVPQKSPFDGRSTECVPRRMPDAFGTLIIPIVQRRYAKGIQILSGSDSR